MVCDHVGVDIRDIMGRQNESDEEQENRRAWGT